MGIVSYEGGVLLKNIKVQRLNRLDRRFFNTSSYIMTYNLHDVMLVEWITYHLMLGVEHFYIYDRCSGVFKKLTYALPSSHGSFLNTIAMKRSTGLEPYR